MLKNKFWVVVLVALTLVGTMALASCRIGCPGTGTCTWDSKKGEGSLCEDANLDYNKLRPSDICDAYMKAATYSYYGTSGDGKCDC